MRFAVLDTNVIVSSGLKPRGICAGIVLDWVLPGLIQIATCPSVVAEYRDVSRRAKFARYGFPPQWLDQMIERSLRLADPRPWSRPLPDPTDAPFLALAHSAGAWLVTGNMRHFPEEARGGVVVVSPREYLEWLDKGERRGGDGG